MLVLHLQFLFKFKFNLYYQMIALLLRLLLKILLIKEEHFQGKLITKMIY